MFLFPTRGLTPERVFDRPSLAPCDIRPSSVLRARDTLAFLVTASRGSTKGLRLTDNDSVRTKQKEFGLLTDEDQSVAEAMHTLYRCVNCVGVSLITVIDM